MAQLIWSDRSIKDLDGIAKYIARDSPKYARLTLINIWNQARRLINHPRLGRQVPEIGDEAIREILYGNYGIIYTIRNDDIHIITVHHSARILPGGHIEEWQE